MLLKVGRSYLTQPEIDSDSLNVSVHIATGFCKSAVAFGESVIKGARDNHVTEIVPSKITQQKCQSLQMESATLTICDGA